MSNLATEVRSDGTYADIAVVGGGPSGLTAALECAHHGYKVALLAPQDSHVASDARTTALMMPSIALLERLGVWPEISGACAALRILRIIDDTGRLLRAPTVDFHAQEIGEDAFGYNIPNQVLTTALLKKIDSCDHISLINGMVSAAAYLDDHAVLTLSNGETVTCKLVVGADGINSIVRQAAAIDVRKWAYPQTASVLAFDHSRPHQDISTEFHTPQGPFTQVPLPGNRSSLVWVQEPNAADELSKLDEVALNQAVESQMQSMLGKISNVTRPQAWPLSSAIAHRFADKRLVLLGQAAHSFPPIGAQGLNLGIRDIADLGKAFATAKDDPGAKAVTNQYDRSRRADVYLRTGAVDLLNRSLLNGFLPLQMGRTFGMARTH